MNKLEITTLSSDDDDDAFQTKMRDEKTEVKEKGDLPAMERQKLSECSNTKVIRRILPTSVPADVKKEEGRILSDEEISKSLFDAFISVCRDSNKSLEMKKIILKTNGYYLRTKPDYRKSLEFQNLLASKTKDISNDPKRIYVYMKDVVDEMKSRKLKPDNSAEEPPCKKSKSLSNDIENICESKAGSSKDVEREEENNEEEKKEDIAAIAERAENKYNERKIKKLSKALKQIRSVIAKLEDKDSTWEEDADSVYMKESRYKERFCKVYQKLCELTGDTNINSRPRGRIAFSGTEYPEVNRCIERFVNKTGQFPDFFDVLKLVKDAAPDKAKKHDVIRSIAEKAFLSVGMQLKKRRQFESWDSVSDFLKDKADPAESDPNIEAVLKKNAEEGEKKIQEVIDTYAEMQDSENLKPEEVPDEAIDNSEGSAEEEEEEEEEEEDEAEADKEKENNFIDKVLNSDEEDFMGEEMKDMNEEEEEVEEEEKKKSEPDDEEPKPVDADNENENIYITSDSEDCYSEDTRTPISSENEDEVLQHIARNMGPVSPPVLGEVLVEQFLLSQSSTGSVSPSLKAKDTTSFPNMNERDKSLDVVSVNSLACEGKKPSVSGSIDSDVIVCSEPDTPNSSHSNSQTVCSKQITATETDGSSFETVIKNGCTPSVSKFMKSSTSQNNDDNLSCSSASTSSTEDNMPSPSLFEPIIETTILEDRKPNLNMLQNNVNNKFVVTEIEVETARRKYVTRAKPGIRRRPRVVSATKSSIDIITIE